MNDDRPAMASGTAYEAAGPAPSPPPPAAPQSPLPVLWVALRLGLTSFGGPAAHLGYFHETYVHRRRWLDEATYADLVALCQFLPGPASSQAGIAIGTLRAGLLGGVLAWVGFTLPSAVALVLLAAGVRAAGVDAGAGWLHGLKLAAVAVVALAVWSMARTLAPDRPRASLAIAAAIAALLAPHPLVQVAVILAAAVAGRWLTPAPVAMPVTHHELPVSRRVGAVCLALFALLLAALPLLRGAGHDAAVFDAFFRTGALVFGGGHVVLPLLQAEVVEPGWVSTEAFTAGYGAAQAVPGPLFTFAAYLGAVMDGVRGAALATAAIFLPSFLLVWGAMPWWQALRARPALQQALRGAGAAVVGLLLAALYDPVWTSAVHAPRDLALVLAAFALLAWWRLPPWMVVAGCALVAALW